MKTPSPQTCQNAELKTPKRQSPQQAFQNAQHAKRQTAETLKRKRQSAKRRNASKRDTKGQTINQTNIDQFAPVVMYSWAENAYSAGVYSQRISLQIHLVARENAGIVVLQFFSRSLPEEKNVKKKKSRHPY